MTSWWGGGEEGADQGILEPRLDRCANERCARAREKGREKQAHISHLSSLFPSRGAAEDQRLIRECEPMDSPDPSSNLPRTARKDGKKPIAPTGGRRRPIRRGTSAQASAGQDDRGEGKTHMHVDEGDDLGVKQERKEGSVSPSPTGPRLAETNQEKEKEIEIEARKIFVDSLLFSPSFSTPCRLGYYYYYYYHGVLRVYVGSKYLLFFFQDKVKFDVDTQASSSTPAVVKGAENSGPSLDGHRIHKESSVKKNEKESKVCQEL